MIRGISVILGIGLVILWIAGLNTAGAPGWMVWLDLVAAICAFVVAGTVPEGTVSATTATQPITRRVGPLTLAVGLYAMWIIGLVTSAERAVPWWNFVFACAFLITAFLPPVGRTQLSSVESPFRRSA